MSKFVPTIYRYFDNADPKYATIKDKKPVTDLAYIKSLRIPPAWTDVLISVNPNEDIAAIGYDSKHRRQYIYTANHWKAAKQRKYRNLIYFRENLKLLRIKTDQMLLEKSLNAVLACVIKLLLFCALRIGTLKGVSDYQSFGITTLQKKHVTITSDAIKFRFVGKKGVTNECYVSTTHPDSKQTATMLTWLYEKATRPDSFLFTFDDQHVTFKQVNEFLKEYGSFTSKDFRTWKANVALLKHLPLFLKETSASKRKKLFSKLLKETIAPTLQHTPAISKKSYLLQELYERVIENPTSIAIPQLTETETFPQSGAFKQTKKKGLLTTQQAESMLQTTLEKILL